MKKVLSLIIAASLMLSFAGCGKKDATDKTAESAGINVTVEKADKNTISSFITGTGEVKPSTEVIVSTKASGTVESVNVSLGDFVDAGQVIATIDSTDYRLQYNQALAGYNQAKAAYNNLTNGTQKQTKTQLQQQIDSAQLAYNNALASYEREKSMYENNVNLTSAKNAVAMAETTYNSTKSLFDMGAASKIELDNAANALENARAAYTATENNLKAGMDAAEAGLKNAEMALSFAKENYALTLDVVTPGNISSAKAALDAAKAALDLAQNSLSNTSIKATVAGYINSCPVIEGQNITAGSPAATIVNSDSVGIEISVTESVITKISAGAEAKISVSSANADDIPGTVSEVSPSKNSQTGMYTVKINVPNEEKLLMGGMFADVTIITEKLEDVLCVPTEAVMSDKTGTFVYIAKDSKAVKTMVETGASDDSFTEILSGVKEGDSIVVSGKEFITEEKNTVKIVSSGKKKK